MKSKLIVSVLWAAVTLIPTAVFAQNAQLSGFVTDASQARVPRANLTITNDDTGSKRTTDSNSDGLYTFPVLEPGQHSVLVEASGFQPERQTGIRLEVGQNARLDFTLKVGDTKQEVTVQADASLMNTTDASVSTVIDRQFVENLPLNGRSFQSLLFLSPGVNANVASANSNYAQGQFVVNGQRGDANYWMVDGVSANVGMGLLLPGAGVSGAVGATNALGGTSALVSVDALQEFRIETSTYAPEFGRLPGGQISIQTRSGTNQFHGTLFDYFRNTDLDATDWFANANGLPKSAEIQNDFGGVLGGPILKDKAFFFFSAEGLRVVQPRTFLGTVPDMASRTAAIPAVQPYLNMYPVPQPGAVDVGPGLAPYSATFSNPGSADAYSLRTDYQLLKNLNLFARYNHAPSNLKLRGADTSAANVLSTVTSVTKTATVGATWAESAHVIDDLRFNFSVSGGKSVLTTDGFGGGTPFPGAGLFPGGSDVTFQNSNVLFYPVFGTNMQVQQGARNMDYQHQYNLVDTLTLQIGSHSLKFGVDYRRLSPSADNYYYQLIPLFDNIADLGAGKSFFTVTDINAPQTFLLHNLGLFAQDTWRVNPRLNLTYGLRWDVDFVPSATRGLGLPAITGFSTTNLSNLALAPVGTPAYSTSYGNVAPRVGVAYQLSTNPDWGLVLRSGFGIFYSLATTETLNYLYFQNVYPSGALDVFSGVPFPTPPSVAAVPTLEPPNIQNQQTLFGLDPHLKVPYALEWNVALEQSLGKVQTLSVSYVGASDRRLLASELLQNPNPNYASANLIGNAGSSNYEALQAQFRRRLTHGLQALVSYNWSHSIDTGSYGAYTNGGLVDVNANRGNSDFDIRQQFSGAVTYNVPVLRNNCFTRGITGGWSLDNIVQIHSGPPVDITDANFSALSAANAIAIIRPNVVPGQPLYLYGPQYPGGKALNPAAFTDPPVGPSTKLPVRQGDLGRNVLRAPGLAQWDFAVHREFPIYERIKLQFRAELFNVLNHPNFGPFNNQFQTGNIYFGQATQMLNQYLGGGATGNGSQNPLYTPGSPRSVELALKLIF
jgi:hypothetical protein